MRRCWKAMVFLDILDTSSEALQVFLASKPSTIHCAICNPILGLLCWHQNHQNELLIRSEKIGCDASFASKQYALNKIFGQGSSFCSVSLESKGIKKCTNIFMPCASLRKPTTSTWPWLYKKSTSRSILVLATSVSKAKGLAAIGKGHGTKRYKTILQFRCLKHGSHFHKICRQRCRWE